MKTFYRLIFSFLMIANSWTLQAQSFTNKGTLETGGELSFSSQSYSGPGNSDALNTLTLSPYLGVMVAEGFELGFLPGVSRTSRNDYSLTQLNLFFAPSYNIKAGNAVPYVEFLIGYNSIGGSGSDESETYDGLGVGFSGGIKVMAGSNGLFLFNIKYLHQEYNIPASNSGFGSSDARTESINTTLASLGFRLYFVS